MGSTSSRPSPLAATFQRMNDWDVKSAKRLLMDYKEKDLDFGLDAQGLAELIDGDTSWAEAIIDSFGGTNGIVNALAFICGAILIASGPALEKANLAFDALDFDMTEQISMDELTILFLCCARGYSVMAAVGKTPSDEELEGVTLKAYRELSKSTGHSITKTEFAKWVIKHIGSASTATANSEVSLTDMAAQFGLVAPEASSIVKAKADEVLREMADENNHTEIDATEHEDPIVPVHDHPSESEANDEALSSEGVGKDEDAGEYVDHYDVREVLPVEDHEALPHAAQDDGAQGHEDTSPDQQQQLEHDDYLPHESASVQVPSQDSVQVSREEQEEEEHTQPLGAAEPSADDFPPEQPQPPLASEELSSESQHQVPDENPAESVDLNAYDTYDYTNEAYQSSSGLPPPTSPDATSQSASAEGIEADEHDTTTNLGESECMVGDTAAAMEPTEPVDEPQQVEACGE